MQIIEYIFDSGRVEDLIKLIGSLYPANSYTNAYQKNVEFLLDQKNPYFKYAKIKNFIAYDNNNCVGHVSAMVDGRLPQIGIVGFFEAISFEVSSSILAMATQWLRSQSIKEVRGPINLSIWHGYRFITSAGSDPQFLFEPFNLPEYPDYFKKFGFQVAENYISGLRSDFSSITNYAGDKYREINDPIFLVRPIDLKNFDRDLKIFHRLSLDIFKESWSFISVSFEEFFSLYKKTEGMINPNYCHFVCKEGREIGFCFSVEDHFSEEKTMIMKTIGILPEFQKNNLGSILIYFQHKDLEANGCKKIIYALMHQGNVASNINPYGARVFRRYEAYSLFL